MLKETIIVLAVKQKIYNISGNFHWLAGYKLWIIITAIFILES